MSQSNKASNSNHNMIHEAARLFFQIRESLHVVGTNGRTVTFIFCASDLLADQIAELGSDIENDEDDGIMEADEIHSH